MIKKFIILFFILLSSNNSLATNICSDEGVLVGFGFEHHGSNDPKYNENIVEQWMRSAFRVPLVGIKCGIFTASTNNLFNLNKGYDVLLNNNSNIIQYRAKSIRDLTIGLNLYSKPIRVFDNDLLLSYGYSYTPSIKIYNKDVKTLDYSANHITISFANKDGKMIYLTYTPRQLTSESDKVDTTITLGIIVKSFKIL